MHLLLFLHLKDRFLNVARVNKIIFVEFFNFKLNFTKKLTNIIRFIMTHDLCDVYNFKTSCIS